MENRSTSREGNFDELEFIKSTSELWQQGDLYNAWMNVYKYTDVDWIIFVIKTLELEPMVIAKSPSTEERSKLLREQIEEALLSLDSPTQLASISELKSSLLSVLSELSAENKKNIPWLIDSCETALSRDVDNSPLSVALLGEFSSGKSRLINALLGEKLLSVGLVPVTRSVTKIRYGIQKAVILEYVNGRKQEILLEELRAYIDERKKSEESDAEVKEVVIESPAEILKRIELWDTPGFNSNNELHDQVATQLLNEADVVVWAMAAHQIGSKSESKLLKIAEKLKGRVIAVLNQVDRIGDEISIKEQLSEVYKHYQSSVSEVIPTSAKWIESNDQRGNLDGFIAALQRIGGWSREEKEKSFRFTLFNVYQKLKIYNDLCIEQAKAKAATERDAHLKAQEILDEWAEIDKHRRLIHGVKDDHTDPWFKKNQANSPRLTKAYEALFNLSISEVEYCWQGSRQIFLSHKNMHLALRNKLFTKIRATTLTFWRGI